MSSLEPFVEAIRALMSEAVRRPLGPQDDFFAAGADSLAVQHVLTGLSAVLDKEVPGWLLLDHPSARALADALAGQSR